MDFKPTPDEVKQLVPSATSIEEPITGGQKVVFPCLIDGKKQALKILNLDDPQFFHKRDEFVDVVTARATREVETMQQCKSPHLVRLGSVPLTKGFVNEQEVLFFSEEWIEGEPLNKILERGPLSINTGLSLAYGMSEAIEELWQLEKIHRDIKPQNIMYQHKDQSFVLLDIGIAFDVHETSLTEPLGIIGTTPYFSPEQFEYNKKRQWDFRSDFFALGTVLYEASTGKHPFYTTDMTTLQIYNMIIDHHPPLPSEINPAIPKELDEIIMSLLKKKPHLRPRTFELLRKRLGTVPQD